QVSIRNLINRHISQLTLPQIGTEVIAMSGYQYTALYLSDRRAYLPNYKARHARRQYIGSAHAEKANDLLVARRQKHQGMHWREASSAGLAALRTLLLNGGWDLYWKEQQGLPLAVLKAT